MNDPAVLPKDYENKFNYEMMLDGELMDVVNQIPDKAMQAIRKDVIDQYNNGDGPGQDPNKNISVEILYSEWEEAHGAETLQNLKAWIPPTFEKFLEPDPFSFVGICGELKALKSKFGVEEGDLVETEFAELTTAGQKLATWEGEFGRSGMNYMNSLYTIVPNHGKVAQALWYNMEAARAIYAQTRKSAKDIAEATISALDYYNDDFRWPWDGPDGDRKLAYAIAIGTVGATAPPPLNVFSATIAGGATILQQHNDDGAGKDIKLAGDTPWDILDNMTAAQGDLDAQILEQENAVRDAFQNGVANRIVEVVNTDFKASEPKNSNLLPLGINTDPKEIYQEDED